MHTKREWWEIEIFTARAIELYASHKRQSKDTTELAAGLINFLRQWNRRQGNNFELSECDGDYFILTLGERATRKNTLDKTVLLVAACTEPLRNLRARAEYANKNGARHVFVLSPSMLDPKQHSLLEEVCQAFFFANPCAGGEEPICVGPKGFVLRTVSPPRDIDCGQLYMASA